VNGVIVVKGKRKERREWESGKVGKWERERERERDRESSYANAS
jgi:hypothetical protein